MNDELKQLIEDAAKLLNVPLYTKYYGHDGRSYLKYFNPCDPERGDLMKVAEAAELVVGRGLVTDAWSSCYTIAVEYTKGNYQSLALAVLRAASDVYKSRGGV